jgi:hypothetical protein
LNQFLTVRSFAPVQFATVFIVSGALVAARFNAKEITIANVRSSMIDECDGKSFPLFGNDIPLSLEVSYRRRENTSERIGFFALSQERINVGAIVEKDY